MLSFSEIRRALCDLFTKAFPDARGDVVDVYPDRCIISDGSGALWEVPYTIDDAGQVATGDMTKVRKQVDYVKIQAAARLMAASPAAPGEETGFKWRVQIVEAGPDKQQIASYDLAVLHAAAPVYEGARVFALTRAQHDDPKNPYGKSVRDIVGWLSDVTPNSAGLEGHFNILSSAKWLRDDLVDIFARGKPDLLGLSHDVTAQVVPNGSGPRRVAKIVKVDSVDIVYDPIAGGKFLRMAASRVDGTEAEKEASMEKLLAALKAKRPDLYAAHEARIKDNTITEDEIIDLLAAAPSAAVSDERLAAAVKQAVDAAGNKDAEKVLEQARITACALTLKDELRDSGLPEISQGRLKARFDGTVFDAPLLAAAIREEKEYLDKLTGSGLVTDSGQIRIGAEEPEKVQAAMDKLLGVDVGDRFQDVPALTSLRAAYERITGDREVRGTVSRDGLRLGAALMEMMRLPAAYASSSFTYVLGNSMYRRGVQEYRAPNYFEDALISYRRNARDFRTLESVLIGYFGDLPDVNPETADYVEATMPTDAEVSYAINQKGIILTVTRRVVLNDDLRSVQTLVSRLFRAARRTFAQRGWNKIITNATWDGDSKAIFHTDHGNLGAVTLTNDATGVTTLKNRLTAMFNQTEADSAKKIGLRPKFMWVPIELEQIGQGLNSPWPGVAGGNPHAGRFGVNHERIITLPLTTDADDWGLIADPLECELMEVAFMNGQQEPELFVADNPLVGQMFVADKVQYKMRHEYEWEAVDYRGFDKSVV